MSLNNNLTPLFQTEPTSTTAPLAWQLAPQSFDDYAGQTHLIGKGKPLRQLIESDSIPSLILWGPPGCGKTALSRLISTQSKADYIAINAVTAKVADIKSTIEKATFNQSQNKKTLLFIDEIHRFNKLQQDALLPDVEKGTIIFIGATTQNPFFSVIPALISRAQVFELHPLDSSDLEQIYTHTLSKLQTPILFDDTAKDFLLTQASGDARKLINLIEMVSRLNKNSITKNDLELFIQKSGRGYSDDDHYDIVSALIKSMRGSDPDASVYWLARMLKGGEDPEFIARRLIIFASEDIGNADPNALPLATSLLQAVQFIGMPEVRINLSHVVTYLATAPKSNAAYMAINKANQCIESGKVFAVPNHLRDAHYKGAKKMGYGNGYKYPHDHPLGLVKQDYMPEQLSLYEPKDIGYEKTIKKRMDYIEGLD